MIAAMATLAAEYRAAIERLPEHEEYVRSVSESLSFPGVAPAMLATALTESKQDGQTAALQTFRQRVRHRP